MTPRKNPRDLRPDVPSSAVAGPTRAASLPWKVVWLNAAETSGSLQEACDLAGVTLGVLHRARRDDPQFDEACRVHDEVVDLRITESLRKNAIEGLVQAQSLYFNRVRELVLGPDVHDRAPASHILAPETAEAMLRAGLEYLGQAPRALPGPADAVATNPSPSSSRPISPGSRKSKKSSGDGEDTITKP